MIQNDNNLTAGKDMILLVVFPTRIFLNPCHRCHLAKLFDNQLVAGNNVAATVTRNGDFVDSNASDHGDGSLPSQREASPIREGRHSHL